MPNAYHYRRLFLLGILFTIAAAMVWRAFYLQVLDNDRLQAFGKERYLKTIEIPAHRGMITDRHGEPLAISTPVSSIWADPQELVKDYKRWPELAKALGISVKKLEAIVLPRKHRRFVYLQRRVIPDVRRHVEALNIAGVRLQQEYRRYYPTSEVAAHVVGFTDVDDIGQEGFERQYNKRLRGKPGHNLVVKDRRGRAVELVENIEPAVPGNPLTLSIDRRLQYIAYRELDKAVQHHKARSGSVVIIDPSNGEVLAMVNQPSYNPNNRATMRSEYYRNRAVTDIFEPGSTMKPFTIATALETGVVEPTTQVDTRPSYFMVGRHTVRDMHNYGVLDVAGVILKSSNVGAAKIALSVAPEVLWNSFVGLGFGVMTESGYPGESPGRLKHYGSWRKIEHATHAFGYGLSVTSVQLAQAYMTLANGGRLFPISLVRGTEPQEGERVIGTRTAHKMKTMLEAVVQSGTGTRAQVPGYRVAGKTGTVHKSIRGGYDERYISLFAGMIPASRPRLVALVMVNDPKNGEYFGGLVAAPIFANIMRDSVRVLNIPPDAQADTHADYVQRRPPSRFLQVADEH